MTPQQLTAVDLWLQDVTTHPPSIALLYAYFCHKLGVKRHWWNKKEHHAIAVAAGAILEIREMVVAQEAKIDLAETKIEQTLRDRKAMLQHALDAQTTAVVIRHRLCVAEEVAAALAAGGGSRLDRALAAYKALEERLS